jgi:ADP-ribosyl-[dinitrogen reductase] hydrolase
MQDTDRTKGCLWGMFIGDALAMPVHWYYNRDRLIEDFGEITKYEAPKPTFPESQMNKSDTGGPGMGPFDSNIIGDVICHGKKHLWARDLGLHYHHGMSPGDNTLDTLICQLLLNQMTANCGKFSPDLFLDSYYTFLTTPDSHKDVYAATAHRMFFANHTNKNLPLSKCADQDGFNIDSIDGLINTIPLAVTQAHTGCPKIPTFAVINCLRKSKKLPCYGDLYTDLLVDLLQGMPIRDAVKKAALEIGLDVEGLA